MSMCKHLKKMEYPQVKHSSSYLTTKEIGLHFAPTDVPTVLMNMFINILIHFVNNVQHFDPIHVGSFSRSHQNIQDVTRYIHRDLVILQIQKFLLGTCFRGQATPTKIKPAKIFTDEN